MQCRATLALAQIDMQLEQALCLQLRTVPQITPGTGRRPATLPVADRWTHLEWLWQDQP